jgi:hypothetical protein
MTDAFSMLRRVRELMANERCYERCCERCCDYGPFGVRFNVGRRNLAAPRARLCPLWRLDELPSCVRKIVATAGARRARNLGGGSGKPVFETSRTYNLVLFVRPSRRSKALARARAKDRKR